MSKQRLIVLAIAGALVAAFCAYGPFAPAAERRHPAPPPARHAHAAHIRQVDMNEIAGLGAWRGCTPTARGASGLDSRQLTRLYCSHAGMGLA